MESDYKSLIELRRILHSHPDLSGYEDKTAARIESYLSEYAPDEIVTGIGGAGLAAIYNGVADGPRVVVRCELDALPIPETIDLDYGSQNQGAAHKCGHDGHMTIVTGLARIFHAQRPEKGTVMLLYQPAEEIGKGALRVVEDKKFKALAPDYVFALHNLPGYPKGQIILREDVFASASKGLIIELTGATSHAAEPEKGRNPALALAQLIEDLSAAPQLFTALHETAKVTVIHARLGEIAFGTSPGYATVMATLRSHSQEVMDRLAKECEELAVKAAETFGLKVSIRWDEEFPATVNDNPLVHMIADTARALGYKTCYEPHPFAWSEDFGHFTGRYRGAMFGLGAGENHPALHHPHYDFPDELIEPGIGMFAEIIRRTTEVSDALLK
jgi:amidohydrolase